MTAATGGRDQVLQVRASAFFPGDLPQVRLPVRASSSCKALAKPAAVFLSHLRVSPGRFGLLVAQLLAPAGQDAPREQWRSMA